MISLIERLENPLAGNFDKEASAYNKRENELSKAGNKDFAVVIYDGSSMHRKFPVKTAEDVEMSQKALARMKNKLPDEIVKTARHYIDIASRRHCKEAAYENLDQDPPNSNVVYAGEINKTAYRQKMQDKKVQQAKEASIEGTSFATPDVKSLREVERQFEVGLDLGPKKTAEVAKELIKRAEKMGTDIRSDAVKRYDREHPPPYFSDEVEFRKMAAPDRLEDYYQELEKKSSLIGAENGMSLIEAAECLRILDKKAGFNNRPGGLSKFGSNAKSPYKIAFPVESSKLSNDLDVEKVAEVFGKEFMNDYQNDPESAISTLSPAEREGLKSIL